MPSPVTFGLIYTFGNPDRWRQPWDARYQATLDQIAWIDRELPIDGIYVTEHHFYDDGYLPSPLVMCGAIAARTQRVAVGTNLVQLPLHNPVRLAEDSLVVDALSGGRFRLGIGMGYYHREFDGLGVPLAQRPSRMDEGIEILRAAFRGEPFSYAGRRFAFPEITVTPPPIRDGGPPIWIGAFSDSAVDRAARVADGFLAFDPATAAVYLEACERHGRPQEERRLNCTYWAIIAEDPERAFAGAGEQWLHLLNQYIVREAFAHIPKPYDDPKSALADGLVFLADAAGAIDEFNRVIAQGAIDINLVTTMPGEEVDVVSERLEYLATHVIPHLDPSEHPAAPANSAQKL